MATTRQKMGMVRRKISREGKTIKRAVHHRISKRVMKRELKRLGEQKEVIEENMRKAKIRVKRAIA
jgi:hypothetical protein